MSMTPTNSDIKDRTIKSAARMIVSFLPLIAESPFLGLLTKPIITQISFN